MKPISEPSQPDYWHGEALFFICKDGCPGSSCDYLYWDGEQVCDSGTISGSLATPEWFIEQAKAGYTLWTFNRFELSVPVRELQIWLQLLFPEWDENTLASASRSAAFTARGAAALLALYQVCRDRWEALAAETVSVVHTLLETADHPLAPIWGQRQALLLSEELQRPLPRKTVRFPAPRPEPKNGVTLSGSAQYFCQKGILTGQWGLETRPPQEVMAGLIETALNEKHFLAVEAGCGVGKSLAYGISLFRWCAATGEQVVVATHTKNLQQQLHERDFPFIDKVLRPEGIAVSWFLLKGRENYLCARRLWNSTRMPPEELGQTVLLASTLVWEQFSISHDLAELHRLERAENRNFWRSITAADEGCLHRRCPWRNRCYYRAARLAARQADIVLVNHALLLADAAHGREVLPPYQRLVIDEAHNLERVAADQFGCKSAYWSIQRLCQRLGIALAGRDGLLPAARRSLPPTDSLQELVNEIQEIARGALDGADGFFTDLVLEYFSGASAPANRLRLSPGTFPDHLNDQAQWLVAQLTKLLNSTRILFQKTTDEMGEWRGELESWQWMLGEWQKGLILLCDRSDDSYVYWVERVKRRATLVAAPRQVGNYLEKYVYEPVDTIIFTSATLTVGRSFSFWQEQVGLASADGIVTEKLAEVFDYDRQVRAAVVRYIPPPDDLGYAAAIAAAVMETTRSTQGGILVLFTSYQSLNAVAKELADKLPAEQLLVQRESGSRERVLERFRDHRSGVLLGTTSFWEGIDVPGIALQSVVMVKLPFPVPDDPMIEARGEDLAAAGRDPFSEYALPLMAIRLRQGYGRLIRTRDDRGFFLLLDERAMTRTYSSVVREVLPHSQWSAVNSPQDLPRFFSGALADRENQYDEELEMRFQQLRALRSQLAREEQVKPYEVFPDRTLKALAMTKPGTLEEMLAVSGIREKKLERYGEIFLRVLNEET